MLVPWRTDTKRWCDLSSLTQHASPFLCLVTGGEGSIPLDLQSSLQLLIWWGYVSDNSVLLPSDQVRSTSEIHRFHKLPLAQRRYNFAMSFSVLMLAYKHYTGSAWFTDYQWDGTLVQNLFVSNTHFLLDPRIGASPWKQIQVEPLLPRIWNTGYNNCA